MRVIAAGLIGVSSLARHDPRARVPACLNTMDGLERCTKQGPYLSERQRYDQIKCPLLCFHSEETLDTRQGRVSGRSHLVGEARQSPRRVCKLCSENRSLSKEDAPRDRDVADVSSPRRAPDMP